MAKSPIRVGFYARISTNDQQTLSLQIKAMQEYTRKRGWQPTIEIKEVGSGSINRPKREKLMQAARKREIDLVIVWRLDRWGRSLSDLIVTLKELSELGVGFISLTEAVDLTTPSGRAMVGMLAVFAEFEQEIRSERIRAGIAQARLAGQVLGRPKSVGLKVKQIRKLFAQGLSKAEIARRLNIGRTSVRRLLASD